MDVKKGEAQIPIIRYRNKIATQITDVLAVEEPLEIFIDGKPYYMIMRLPGEEMALALGYCFSEGIIDSRDEVRLINYCGEETGNRVYVTLDVQRKNLQKDFTIKERCLPAYSSCGICGKQLIEDICTKICKREGSFILPVSQIDELIDIVQEHQQLFAQTGATHAAAAFDENLQLLAFAEDVGRHNALDKVLGKLILAGKVAATVVMVVTSRVSYEVVQKTGRSGAQILIGISSATSLAVQLATDINLTLVGFARRQQGNIYTVADRIKF